jgi:hypothetical protein
LRSTGRTNCIGRARAAGASRAPSSRIRVETEARAAELVLDSGVHGTLARVNGPICIRCGQPIATMPIATPQGYQHDRCPSRGMSGGAIAALVGCGGLFLLALAFALLLAFWQLLSPEKPTASASPSGPTTPPTALVEAPEALSLSFATKNGLVTVHYPPSFAASTPNEHDVLLQRRSAGGEVVIAVDAIDHPISDHLEEVDRVVRLETGKRYAGFVPGPTTKTTCHDHPGVASSGTFAVEGVSYESRACAYMNGAHYHRCFYVAPAAELAELEPSFKQICAAVEIH